MREVYVLSSDLDGAELRRKKRNKPHIRCDGTGDEQQINEAIETTSRPVQYTGFGPGRWWRRDS